MITVGEELTEIIDGEYVGQYYAALRAANLREFRTGLRIKGTEFERGVINDTDIYQDRWQLERGRPYIVEFEETVDLPEGYVPLILPTSMTLEVGGVAQTRLANDGELWTVFVPHAPVDVDVGSVLAITLILKDLIPPSRISDENEDEDSQRDGGTDSDRAGGIDRPDGEGGNTEDDSE